jgi:glycolate oxidase FAD binding subunit
MAASDTTDLLQPTDEAELAAAIGEAAARRTPLAIEGGGTLRGLGRPMQTAATLATRRLAGVTLYEPAEMVLSARAGTPLAEVEALLAAKGQRLAFEPPDLRSFYGSAGTPTVGAVAAANLSGPRRIAAGAARDGLIGVRAVTGRGELVKSGGRVMKNVTGLDLVKFLAGSHGTLAVMSEVTFKVLPMPEGEATLVYRGLEDGRAVAALSAALGSPFAVTGAAHVPRQGGESARTLVRIEGFVDSVRHRLAGLIDLLADCGAAERLDGGDSAACWQAVRDLAALAAPAATAVWRISVKPGDGPPVVASLGGAEDRRVLYDWGGGLVFLATAADPAAGAAARLRAAVAAVGGHATLIRAPDPVRLATEVFAPPTAPVAALSRRLKAAFDPAGILNPGRMYSGL